MKEVADHSFCFSGLHDNSEAAKMGIPPPHIYLYNSDKNIYGKGHTK